METIRILMLFEAATFVYHVGILVVLAMGLRVTARWRADETG